MKERKLKNHLGNKIKVIFNEITPKHFSCGIAACPSIFEKNNDDTLIIIGKKVDLSKISVDIKKKIGDGETAIEVPKKLITELFSKT